jgi:hypothetical protein
MNPESQTVAAWRSPWILVLLAFGAVGFGAAEVRADIQVHVKNCTSNEIEFQAYDSKDSVKAVAASTKKLSSSGDTASLHCAGEGKGYCQMELAILEKPVACSKVGGSIAGSLSFHLDSDKWAVVTGYQQSQDSKGDWSCTPTVEENLDSAPSCD